MARCRFVQPKTTQIALSDGDWIEVKEKLTAGEQRRAHAGAVKDVGADGRVTLDLEMVGKAQVMAYLVDWSLIGPDKKVVDISTDAKKAAALDAIDPATSEEINAAVVAHAQAIEDAEKNSQGGELAPSATSSSAA